MCVLPYHQGHKHQSEGFTTTRTPTRDTGKPPGAPKEHQHTSANQETTKSGPGNLQNTRKLPNTTETAPREHQYIIRTIRDEHCDQERPPGKNQEETNRRQPRNGRRRPGHPLRSAGDTGKAGPKRNSFKSSCHKCARCPMANRCASLPRGQPPISRRMHDPFMHHGDVTAK